MMPAGSTAAPETASSRKAGPATSTVVTVDPMSTPAASAASPPAMAVVATDAISQGASPIVASPSRSGPGGAICATAHDSAGNTVIPASNAAASDRHATTTRFSAAGSIVSAVANTSMASSTLIPSWRASHASGGWITSPSAAATTTMASSGYAPASERNREIMERAFPDGLRGSAGQRPTPVGHYCAVNDCGRGDGRARDITAFLYEIGQLKRYPRTGWHTAGVTQPESVADHCFRASVIAAVIASLEGADPQRAAFLALWHDSQETRTTDLSHLTKKYVSSRPNEAVTSDQVRRLPEPLAGVITAAVAEYEARETPEARCARDADKLELLLQAREYTDQGHPSLRPFLDSARSALRTEAARELAAEAMRQGYLDWVSSAMEDRP
jgi:putative hydrolases of HD superfamily